MRFTVDMWRNADVDNQRNEADFGFRGSSERQAVDQWLMRFERKAFAPITSHV